VRLITAHRILIGAGIAFFLFYALLHVWHYTHGGGGADVVQAVVAAAVAVGLVVYFRSLRGWGSPRS
jgi:hypothetical protein